MNAMDIMASVISTMGNPLNGIGTSATCRRSTAAVMSKSTKEKPNAEPIPKASDFKNVIDSS